MGVRKRDEKWISEEDWSIHQVHSQDMEKNVENQT
jgi:hypothetical protein